jgi:exo-1,4-beta-D-glucosaminidase
LTALASLPPATVQATAELENSANGRELRVHLNNNSSVLAFQLRAAVRTTSGGLIAPVFWSDNWIELAPGESTTLTAILPQGESTTTQVQIEGWNVAPNSIAPTATTAAR